MKTRFLSLILIVLADRSASAAGDKYLCCNLPSGSAAGPCIAQSAPCVGMASYNMSLSNLATVPAGWTLEPGTTDAVFPAGTDGYLSWSAKSPWTGFCLDAPSSVDPLREVDQAEPLGCLTITLRPGIGAFDAVVEVPKDPRWDSYQRCFGAPTAAADGGTSSSVDADPNEGVWGPCQNVNDLDDPTVSPTPISGSCCSRPELLKMTSATNPNNWTVEVAQEIPSVPPPVLIYDMKGNLVAFYTPMAGDTFADISASMTCLDGYDQPSMCGSIRDGGAVPAPIAAALTDGGQVEAPTAADVTTSAGSGGCSVAETRGSAHEILLMLGLAAVAVGTRRRRA